MKSRTPREWETLSKKDKKKITDYCVSVLNEQEEKDMRIIIELLIKMLCCVLHDTEGFGEKRLMLLIGNLQMVFKEQTQLVSKGEQINFLDNRMKKIFKKNGFPQTFFDSLLGKKDEKSLTGVDVEELLG